MDLLFKRFFANPNFNAVPDRYNGKLSVLFFALLAGLLAGLVNWYAFRNRIDIWPAMDQFPYFERMANPQYLSNDFFTDASQQPNPRHIYGNFINTASKTFGVEYWQVLTFIGIVSPIVAAFLIFLLLFNGLPHFKSQYQEGLVLFLLVFLVGFVWLPTFSNRFTYAGWKADLVAGISAQSLSATLQLIGVGLVFFNRRIVFVLLGWLLLFYAGLLHPVIGLLGLIFWSILYFGRLSNGKLLINIFLGGLMPIVIVKLMFKQSVDASLSVTEYFNIYILRHSVHYLPSAIETTKILLLSAIPALLVAFVLRKNKVDTWLNVLILALVSIAIIFVQIVFVKIIPLKAVMTLGPSRFFIFGYFGLIYALLSLTIKSNFRIGLVDKVSVFIQKYKILVIEGLLILVLLMVFVRIKTAPNFPEGYYRFYDKIVEYIAKNTSEDDVFVVPDRLDVQVYILAKRRVAYWKGFPFNEHYFREFFARRKAIHGDFSQSGLFEKLTCGQMYQNALHYKPTMVVFDNQSQCRPNVKPIFSSAKYSLYRFTDLTK